MEQNRPDPSVAGSPAQFTDALNRLRAWAGEPSLRTLRDLAHPPGALPTSTVHDILSGRRLPRMPRAEFVDAYVTACLRAYDEAAHVRDAQDGDARSEGARSEGARSEGARSEGARAEGAFRGGESTEDVLKQWRETWRRLSDAGTGVMEVRDDAQMPIMVSSPRRAEPARPASARSAPARPAGRTRPARRIPWPAPPRIARIVPAVALFLAGILVGGLGVRFLPLGLLPPAVPPEVECLSDLPPVRPGATELLRNGTFDNAATEPWWTNATGLSLTAANRALVAHVPDRSGNPWDAMVIQRDLQLRTRASYVLTFRITASRPGPIRVVLQDDVDYEPALIRVVRAGPRPCLVSVAFSGGPDTNTGELAFQAGSRQPAYSLTIDDVSLTATF
ncbi:carbohydrate binding domain-containing protein [Catenuloplanes japonicus]|uniref:carbohydrate binding domain-containing protein n=1 Tax=Catenuloplanes japonicus TaxID=33876 RepID=UPI0005257F0D|nr:carbohydrate binding domain-containing protein [Catenuloplanes japonicus]